VGGLGAGLDPYHGSADLGYWITADHEGRGILTRPATALLDHVFTDRGIARAEIRTSVENRRSRAAAERLGFAHEGTLRSALPVGDRRHDLAVYGLVAPNH
jgi:ribosomal-protein-serine acetyltransferase